MTKTDATAVELHIVDRLKKLLPKHSPEERQQLKENIEKDGEVRDAILYWFDGTKNVIIDGMTRFEIVRGTTIPYRTKEMHFDDYEQAELWILDHQLGRRNLMDPMAIRLVRGQMYNRLKRQDGGHGDQRSGGHDVTPIATAAHEVAEKAGVSERTVKRDGARAAALDKLTKAARDVAEKATDPEVKALATLDHAAQDTVARAVRVGQAPSIKEAIKLTGVKQKGQDRKHDADEQAGHSPSKSSGPPPVSGPDKKALFKEWEKAIGPLMRTLDRIANSMNGKNGQSHRTVVDHLDVATEEMMEWLGVKK